MSTGERVGAWAAQHPMIAAALVAVVAACLWLIVVVALHGRPHRPDVAQALAVGIAVFLVGAFTVRAGKDSRR